MDDLTFSRAQLKALDAHALKIKDSITITAKHEEDGMILVEPAKRRGEGLGKWMMRDGSWRKEN
jgi:hypothetical protein